MYGVGLSRSRETAALSASGQIEREACDALDVAPREEASLLGDMVRRRQVQRPAEGRILSLRVLAHADHVDLGRCASRKRPDHTWQEAHRPQGDILLDSPPD